MLNKLLGLVPAAFVAAVCLCAAAQGVELQRALGAQVAATAAAGGWSDGFDRVSETHFEPGLGTSAEEARAVEPTITVGAVVLRPKRALQDQMNGDWVRMFWEAGRKAGHPAVRARLVAELAAVAEKSGLSAAESDPVAKAGLALYDEPYGPSADVWCVGNLETPLSRLGAGMLSLKAHVLGQADDRRPVVMRYAYEAFARALVARVTNEALPPDEPAAPAATEVANANP